MPGIDLAVEGLMLDTSSTEGINERTDLIPQKHKKNAAEYAVEGDQEIDTPFARDTTPLEVQKGIAAAKEAPESLEAGDYTPKRTVRQKCIKNEETFAPHPTDSTKIIATFRIQIPHGGGEFVQVDEIPETRVAPATSDNAVSCVVYPSLVECKVPRKIRGSKNRLEEFWVKNNTEERWTRGTGDNIQFFKPTVIFRAFNAITYEYEFAYVGEKKLENVDPNNKIWTTSYNKWIDQIKRRRDSMYVQTLHRTHWTVPEKQALYTAINDFCEIFGLFRFGFGKGAEMVLEDLQGFADEVNREGRNNRNVDSIRGQITSAHAEKNKEIYELLERADALRAKRNENPNVKLPLMEEFPHEVIPLSAFPREASSAKSEKDRKSRKSAVSIKTSKKRNGDAAFGRYEVASDSDEGIQPASTPLKNGKQTSTRTKAGNITHKARKKRTRTSISRERGEKEEEPGEGELADDVEKEEAKPEMSGEDILEIPLSLPSPPNKNIVKKRKGLAIPEEEGFAEGGWRDTNGKVIENKGGEREDVTRLKKKAQPGKAARAEVKAIVNNDSGSDRSDVPSLTMPMSRSGEDY
ncbi:uncharacterized protein K460DRAFT_405534 [Cucurbitaria berberidis CBS 394.84]|uniref:Uncharacterized protein n=1 Tax=Cucurbitaria berberidis CBS 394.84 TaxID=1168544 RepID=A0A9P4L8I1_9PLEO|nr:uncharacterized protein K460DRAFT_405534 [Cucurbitaria berberidis CBS 394.84]KAF1845269.1 hypothetical protein K460DRAFT_405534 [Cucurbitaria berberidis CBS 394.84]